MQKDIENIRDTLKKSRLAKCKEKGKSCYLTKGEMYKILEAKKKLEALQPKQDNFKPLSNKPKSIKEIFGGEIV